MKHLMATLLALFLLASPVFTQEPAIQKVSLPKEVRQEMRVDDADIKGKQWNRWTSKNFVVCSINDVQAKYLHENLEGVKTAIYERWGFPDMDFSAECRLICVDDKNLYKKLFGIDQTKIEVRKDGNKVKMYVIFLLLDDRPSKTLPIPLTEVCITELENKVGSKLGFWAHRGMAHLNTPIDDIRKQVNDLYPYVKENKSLYFSKGLFTMTEEQYGKESAENKDVFDKCSLTLCLLLRKEFGQDKYLQFLKESSGNPETALQKVYGFKGYDEFDLSYKRFLMDLTSDVAGVRPGRSTPDHYLQVRPKGK